MTEEQITTPPTNENQKQDETHLLEVDVYGEKVKLPLEQAKSIIAKRDERHSVFKNLDVKVKEYESKLAETTRTAAAQKAALEGRLAEAETLFTQKANERLDKIHNRIVQKELESALLSDESFLKETKDDALKLLKSEYKFKLNEEGDKVITEEGLDATEVVKTWLSSKSFFKKSSTIPSTGAKVGPKSNQKVINPTQKVNVTEALLNHLNKGK